MIAARQQISARSGYENSAGETRIFPDVRMSTECPVSGARDRVEPTASLPRPAGRRLRPISALAPNVVMCTLLEVARLVNGGWPRINQHLPACRCVRSLTQTVAIEGQSLVIGQFHGRELRRQRNGQPADQAFGAPVELGLASELRLDAGDHASGSKAA